MFIQSAFIRKNTQELRNKLEVLGYTNGAWESPHFEYPYLIVYPNKQYGIFKGDGFYITEDDIHYDGKIYPYNVPDNCVDCGTNEDLFIAIASLRDDTDKNQWFVYDDSDWNDEPYKVYFICTEDKVTDFLCINLMYNDCHKLDIEEIFELFEEELI